MGYRAVCPFFRYNRANFITCEGCFSQTSKNEFKSKEEATEYYNKFCADKWEECLQAEALNYLYEKQKK